MVTMSWIKDNKNEWNIKVVKDGIEDIVKPVDVMGKYGTDAEALEAFKNVLGQVQVVNNQQQTQSVETKSEVEPEILDVEQGRQM